MTYLMKKPVNLHKQDMILNPLDVDFAYRTISLTGEIDDDVATVINAALRCLARESSEDIILYIQSPGGEVSAGLSIYDTAKALNCDVVTVASGTAASMAAFLLAAAGSTGKRWAQPNAKIIIHQPFGEMRGQASDIRIRADEIIKTRAKLTRIFSQCTGQSIQKIEQDTDRDHIMTAEEAVAYGLIDKIGDPISEFFNAKAIAKKKRTVSIPSGFPAEKKTNEGGPFFKAAGSDSRIDIETLVSKIDAKIAEFEAQEEAERQKLIEQQAKMHR